MLRLSVADEDVFESCLGGVRGGYELIVECFGNACRRRFEGFGMPGYQAMPVPDRWYRRHDGGVLVSAESVVICAIEAGE